MKNLNKTALAISFSVLGALSSMSAIAMSSAEHKEQRIEIIADGDKDVQIFVSADGELNEIEMPKEALSDAGQLESYLSELPDDLRAKVINQLTNIQLDAKMIKIHTGDGQGLVSNWVDTEAEHVIVLKQSEGEDAASIAKQMVHKFAHGDGKTKIFKFNNGGKIPASAVIKLLEHAELSADDLDKIQQALDAKR